MMRLSESRLLDMNAEALGVGTAELMENAGRAVADAVLSRTEGDVLIACGGGNNGGDGAVAARHLAGRRGVTVALAVTRSGAKSQLLERNLRALPRSVRLLECAEPEELPKAGVIVDALLGTGLRAEPREPYASWIKAMNRSGATIVSVDVPSGLGTGLAVKPDITVTFHDAKEGMTAASSGDVIIADIGIPAEAHRYTGPGEFTLYPIPAKDTRKGLNGSLLIVGGGPYAGAPALAAFGAQAVGVDLAVVAAPSSCSNIVASYSPNFIVRPLEGDLLSPGNVEAVAELSRDADAVLVGPGLGREPETVKAVRSLLSKLKRPVVIDADGLSALAQGKPMPFTVPAVLTPHSGEFTRLGGSEELDGEAVSAIARKLKATVLLKRPVDIISDGERVKLNRTGNPAMSHGGTGDVLAGLVGGLLAKGLEPFDAARLGAYISGLAGDDAFDNVGYSLTATDVVACVPRVLIKGLGRLE
jgi:NAD(P)H-hydrate epimerase